MTTKIGVVVFGFDESKHSFAKIIFYLRELKFIFLPKEKPRFEGGVDPVFCWFGYQAAAASFLLRRHPTNPMIAIPAP